LVPEDGGKANKKQISIMRHRRQTHIQTDCISVSHSDDELFEQNSVHVNETAFESAGNFNYSNMYRRKHSEQ
jgi:hypothetical protein